MNSTLVLILIVVEDGLVRRNNGLTLEGKSLNPYCSGRWSRTFKMDEIQVNGGES